MEGTGTRHGAGGVVLATPQPPTPLMPIVCCTGKELEATLDVAAPQAVLQVVSQPPAPLVSSGRYEGNEPEVTPPPLARAFGGYAKEGDHPEALLLVCRASLLLFCLHFCSSFLYDFLC